MAENLRVTRFNDGNTIRNLPDGNTWSNTSAPGHVWYAYDISRAEDYGAIYNSFVIVGTANVCPTGWHVPTVVETAALIDRFGGMDAWILRSCPKATRSFQLICQSDPHRKVAH